jgi:DNA-binding NarL/FixJ family response regulator
MDHDGETLHDPVAQDLSRRIARTPAKPRAALGFKGRRVTRPSNHKHPISVMLVEDNRLFRLGLSSMIRRQGDLKLLASTQRPALAAQARLQQSPDVVLIDAGLGDRESVRVVRDLRASHPEAKLIMLGLIPLEPGILSLVKAGISGFVLKAASIGEFISTIRAVAAGKRVFPACLTDSLLSQIVDDAAGRHSLELADVRVTPREREIVDLIAHGLSNKEIAQRLCIATDTVKSHVHNILEKLSLRSRVEVAVRARLRAPAAGRASLLV